MYAACPIRDALHSPGAPLLESSPYFDAAPYEMLRTESSPYFKIHGGVRARAFARTGANSPAILSRVPLVRWRTGMRYLGSTANITPVVLANILAAVLRFEFLSDFAERSPTGLALCDGLSTNLYSNSSVRYQNSAQLVELGLMKTERVYEESAQLTAAARLARSA
jgi:hypothetical protein